MGARSHWVLFIACLCAGAACGGSTTSTGSGATGGGATGGSTSGGSGGTALGGAGGCGGGGAMDCVDECSGHFTSPICESGSWTCPPSSCDGGGGCAGFGSIDCVSQCNNFYLPICKNGNWICDTPPPCTCAAGEVKTVNGCQTCADAMNDYTAAVEAARKANASCSTPADCVLADIGTTCAGECPVAISKGEEVTFAKALEIIEASYCGSYASVCGYSSPKCAAPTLVCPNGSCETSY